MELFFNIEVVLEFKCEERSEEDLAEHTHKAL